MKGDEGCVLVIVLVTICVSGIYIGGVKGDDFFLVSLLNFPLFVAFLLYRYKHLGCLFVNMVDSFKCK